MQEVDVILSMTLCGYLRVVRGLALSCLKMSGPLFC